MFSHHPFTLEHRYSLGAGAVLPIWKRALDLACCAVALPLLGLVTFFHAVIVRLSSPGPLFYRQESAGSSGHRFRVYRFRTMQMAAVQVTDRAANDPRLVQPRSSFVSGGRFLRASGLVDLPQIVNVLRGEMSIVGPRPMPYLNSAGSTSADGMPREAVAVPGLTGFWRLPGTSMNRDELIQWERTYAEKLSFWTDLKMIGRTLIAMLNLRLSP